MARSQVLASSEEEDEPAPCSAGHRHPSAEKRQPHPFAAAGAAAPRPHLLPMAAPKAIRMLRKPRVKVGGNLLEAADQGPALPVISTPALTAPNRISGKRAAPDAEQLFAVAAAAACQPTATAVGPCAAAGVDEGRRGGSEAVSNKRALQLRGASGVASAPVSHEGHGESHTPVKARRAVAAPLAATAAAPKGAAAATAAATTAKRGKKHAVVDGPAVCTRSSRRGRS